MKLLAVDSNSIFNRAFYGIKLLTTKDGAYTNALVGFLNIFHKLLEDVKPDAVVFAFDLRGPTFRHKMYDGYKAQRKGMPPELAEQLPILKEILTLMGYPMLACEGYEADDILGTLAARCGQGDECVIATGDRDALQLVRDNVTVLLATTKGGSALYTPMTPDAVREKYGIAPAQLIDVKALMGDSSDNIPGVPGVGEKTALSLMAKHHSLDDIYSRLQELELTPSLRTKLENGRDSAFMSRELAKICCEAPVETDYAAFAKGQGDGGKLYRLLARLEMFSHIKKLHLTPPEGDEQPAGGQAPAPALQWLESLPQISGEGTVYFAAQWDGADITALALLWEGQAVLCQAPGRELLERLLTLPNPKCFDDSKAFWKAVWPGKIENVVFDCRLAGYLLSPNSNDYSPGRLAAQYDLPAPRLERTGGAAAGGEEAVPELLVQAARLPGLAQRFEELLKEKEQMKLLTEMELPLARVLASMERLGFAIDTQGLTEFGRELDVEIDRLQREIWELAGGEFNINSPKQMGEVLFERLELPIRRKTKSKSGYSTDAEVLESLVSYHPVISKILDYRRYTKLKSTYVEGLGKQVEEDGRIHSVFNQTETRTGRISSAEPNLQNIPVRTELGGRLRKFFHAAEGCVLVDADYSQIELRVLASIANDTNMIHAFTTGEDIHTNTAAQVFDLPPLFVTPQMRSRAKAVNFGIVYGIGAFSLSKDIGVSVAEADQYIKNYLKTYSGVREYMERTVESAKEIGYVSTVFGRRRYLPELHNSNRSLRLFGERVAMNAPIQGTAADIIKIAMVRVFNRLEAEGLRARLILQVHDELIVEAPVEESERVAALLKEEMVQAADLAVPMEVDLGVGRDWQEAH